MDYKAIKSKLKIRFRYTSYDNCKYAVLVSWNIIVLFIEKLSTD